MQRLYLQESEGEDESVPVTWGGVDEEGNVVSGEYEEIDPGDGAGGPTVYMPSEE